MKQLALFERPRVELPEDTTVIVVSISGGKDSIATLLEALETGLPVLAHHQIVLEDWPYTIEYCQQVCDRLAVPFHMSQAKYFGYECLACGYHYLTSRNVQRCSKCQSQEATFLRMVESVLDLVEWRKMWPSLAVRFCTSYFKRDNFNRWARENRQLLLGDHPVIAMGERWLESRGRARLPELRTRSGLDWMIEWRPVLGLRRIDVFRKMQASYQTPQGRPIIDRALGIEKVTGHTLKNGLSLAEMIGA